MDLNFSSNATNAVKRTRAFIKDVVEDVEDVYGGVAQDDAGRRSLQDSAKLAGVFGPHLPVEL